MIWPVPPLAADDAVELFVARTPGRRRPARRSSDEHARGRSPRSAPASTGCRSPSSWPRPAPGRSRSSRSPSRLNDRFRLLTGGSRTALPRQQTLRAVVDWSYELLFDDEQRVFERLSVFPGGCDLATAEAVCADETLAAADLDDLIHALVDKSLVIAVPTGDAAAVHPAPDARPVRPGEARRAGRRRADPRRDGRALRPALRGERRRLHRRPAASVAHRDRPGARQPPGRARVGGRQRRRRDRADDRRRRQLAALARRHIGRGQALARRRVRVRGRGRRAHPSARR